MLLSAAIALNAHTKDTTPLLKTTSVHGLPVTVEHPKGTERKLHDDSGKVVFKKLMMYDYGFFDKTKVYITSILCRKLKMWCKREIFDGVKYT